MVDFGIMSLKPVRAKMHARDARRDGTGPRIGLVYAGPSTCRSVSGLEEAEM